ncbi:hypothetical protein PLICRDRAFT_177027 [Plicaturopsis crispa FD-325 SS-3]|nr:hypothetical protein PLICRDRAFT_177027 [Plicaturopsis crispa FD-325 SS-3]
MYVQDAASTSSSVCTLQVSSCEQTERNALRYPDNLAVIRLPPLPRSVRQDPPPANPAKKRPLFRPFATRNSPRSRTKLRDMQDADGTLYADALYGKGDSARSARCSLCQTYAAGNSPIKLLKALDLANTTPPRLVPGRRPFWQKRRRGDTRVPAPLLPPPIQLVPSNPSCSKPLAC